jgi:hypothetical protein
MDEDIFYKVNFLNGNPINLLCQKKDISLIKYVLIYFTFAIIFFGIAVLLVELDQGYMMRQGYIERSFYNDYNYISFLLLTIPGLIILIIRLRWLIPRSISELIKSKILILNSNYLLLVKRWNKICFRNNLIAIIFVLIFLSVAFPITIRAISNDSIVSFQTRGSGNFVLPGYWFIFSTLILSVLLVSVISLILNQIYFLKELVQKYSEIEIQVLHPDKLGGLSPITEIGYAFQHVLVLIGINISIMIYTWFFVGVSGEFEILVGYSIILVTLYILLTPVLFLAPLVLFRKNILKIKGHTLIKIGNQYNQKIKKHLKSDIISISPDEVDNLSNLKYLYDEVEKLPEWPFDWGTLKKLSITFFSPLIPILISWTVKIILT